ncbi:hypothetical protein OJJOAM_001541 [Cupriavidus sp. H18C1]
MHRLLIRSMLRHVAALSVALSAVVAVTAPAAAQGPADYPSKPIRYVVPFAPGGLTDIMARMVGHQLSEEWGKPIVIDNKPGGNANIGADQVAKAPADGYTWLAVTLTHASNVTLFPKLPFNMQKDLVPVARIASSPMTVVVPANSPIQSMKDLVEAARKGKLNAGSSGNGTPPHLTLALFESLTGTKLTHVPYKGGAPSMTDLIGGQIDVVFSNFPESLAYVKGGKLRALAVTTRERHPLLPDVPTVGEVGFPRPAGRELDRPDDAGRHAQAGDRQGRHGGGQDGRGQVGARPYRGRRFLAGAAGERALYRLLPGRGRALGQADRPEGHSGRVG